MYFLMNRIDSHSGEIFQSLYIHVLEVADLGKLGPKRDVQRQGNLQGFLNVSVGHNSHGGGLTIG
jgi:hypothetical protein